MTKLYEFKLYDEDGTFKKQINSKLVTSDVSFSEELNWGQSNLKIDVVDSLSEYQCSDIIEVREVDEDNKSISPTYTGIIEEINVTEYQNVETLSVTCLGVFSVLNDVLYRNSGTTTFSMTNTAGNIAKNIIDNFNLQYGAMTGDTKNIGTSILTYTATSIDTSWSTLFLNFSTVNCLSALKTTLENSGFDWYIGYDGVLYVQQPVNQTVKVLTFERELLSIDRTVHKRDMTNKYYLGRNGGTVVTYSDVASQGLFRLKEEYESKTDIGDLNSQNVYGNQKIADYAYERNEIALTLKPLQTGSILPGYRVTTLNSRNQIVAEKITKIDKNSEKWKIYLGDFVSLWKTIIQVNL
jgi:hypothetical protein